MKHRTAMILATALTVFVLILIGAVTAVTAPKVAASNVSPTFTETATSTATLSPTNTTVPPTTTKVSAQASFLSALQAKNIALKLAPKAVLEKDPELVNYKARMAYEVLLDVGAVYVDAFSGQVLFNGIGLAAAPPLAPVDANAGNDGGGGQNSPNPAAGGPVQNLADSNPAPQGSAPARVEPREPKENRETEDKQVRPEPKEVRPAEPKEVRPPEPPEKPGD